MFSKKPLPFVDSAGPLLRPCLLEEEALRSEALSISTRPTLLLIVRPGNSHVLSWSLSLFSSVKQRWLDRRLFCIWGWRRWTRYLPFSILPLPYYTHHPTDQFFLPLLNNLGQLSSKDNTITCVDLWDLNIMKTLKGWQGVKRVSVIFSCL